MPYKDPVKRREYHRQYSKKWSEQNRQKCRTKTRLSMQRLRDQDPELAAQKMREWRKNNTARSNEMVANYKKKNPDKDKAHRIVGRAIKTGELKRLPCEICGSLKSQAHHDDYTKPLEVRWLCQKHHSQTHKNLKA